MEGDRPCPACPVGGAAFRRGLDDQWAKVRPLTSRCSRCGSRGAGEEVDLCAPLLGFYPEGAVSRLGAGEAAPTVQVGAMERGCRVTFSSGADEGSFDRLLLPGWGGEEGGPAGPGGAGGLLLLLLLLLSVTRRRPREMRV